MNQPKLHVVLGAGQIGSRLTQKLLAAGHRVRQVRRGTTVMPGAELMSGSIADPVFARAALAGADTAWHCVNPSYEKWTTELLPITRGIIEGAAKAGSRLVVLDNLYMYSAADQNGMSENTAINPSSRKGHLRAEAASLLLSAHQQGDIPVVIGRASDFYGPGIINAHFGERFFQRVLAGKAAECFGDPDQPHSFSYGDDVVDGLITLSKHPDAFGKPWLLPCAEPITPRQLTTQLGAALGVKATIAPVPTWVLTMLGVFVPVMRELAEMRYQWLSPYRVDDRLFRTTFGKSPTAMNAGITATATWARARFANIANS